VHPVGWIKQRIRAVGPQPLLDRKKDGAVMSRPQAGEGSGTAQKYATDRTSVRMSHVIGRFSVRKWMATLMLVALGIGFLFWLFVFAPQLIAPARSGASLIDVADRARRHELEDARLRLQNDVRTTLLQALGGVALVAGASFTYRQVQTARHQLEVIREGQVTERFTRAIDQLGHQELDVRVGGIYALERIARDSDPDRGAIVEVLTTFVRHHSTWSGGSTPLWDVPRLGDRSADVQAAMTVLGRNKGLTQPMQLMRVDLRKLRLSGPAFPGGANLRGAYLYDSHLEGAILDGANLQGAVLDRASLQEAVLSGANLQGAFLKGTQLERANLWQANLTDATADANTTWPEGFDASAEGVRFEGS
jgi:Pentapeptide repeats (8 copies)